MKAGVRGYPGVALPDAVGRGLRARVRPAPPLAPLRGRRPVRRGLQRRRQLAALQRPRGLGGGPAPRRPVGAVEDRGLRVAGPGLRRRHAAARSSHLGAGARPQPGRDRLEHRAHRLLLELPLAGGRRPGLQPGATALRPPGLPARVGALPAAEEERSSTSRATPTPARWARLLDEGERRGQRPRGHLADLRAERARARRDPGPDGDPLRPRRVAPVLVRLQRRGEPLPERPAGLLRQQRLPLPRRLLPRDRGPLRRRLPAPAGGRQRAPARHRRVLRGLGVRGPGRHVGLRGAGCPEALGHVARAADPRVRRLRPGHGRRLRLQLRRLQPQPGRRAPVDRPGLAGRHAGRAGLAHRRQQPHRPHRPRRPPLRRRAPAGGRDRPEGRADRGPARRARRRDAQRHRRRPRRDPLRVRPRRRAPSTG